MTIFCVAFVGKYNEPLYFYSKEETAEYLHLQMIVHSCLDVVEERKKRAILSTTSFDMYLGQLFPIEDYRCFGSYCNTHNKTIIICDSGTTETGGIKDVILALNSAFANAIQNPFQPTGQPITSQKFNSFINQIVQRHNTLSMKRKV
eukprot:gene9684-13037_t